MNHSTRLALSLAAVAVLVGLLSYHAASDRITGELDRTLQSATVSIANGQDRVLDPITGPRQGDDAGNGDRPHREPQQPKSASCRTPRTSCARR